MAAALQFSSLSDQVYDYLRKEMNEGTLVPGSTINIGEIAKKLGISKTPLRDALIHLEIEGFVTILPRRGVKVNELSLADIKNAYDSIGLIEASVVVDGFDRITPAHINELIKLNEAMIRNIENDDFSTLFKDNLAFHQVYLDVSDNDMLMDFIYPIKHRLYDFPRQNYLKEWEMRNSMEHRQFIECLKAEDPAGAARILKDIHWSYEVQKEFIYTFYKVDQSSPE